MTPFPRLIRLFFPLCGLALSAAWSGCLNYGRTGDPDCHCDSPPASECVDATTLRVHRQPGTCVEGVCRYDFEDQPCASGACVDGECISCQPVCSGRQCGPDGCGGQCGSCPNGQSCNPDGICQSGCSWPQHPFDCALVSDFQCGIEARCQTGTIVVDWHEHVFCDGQEEIVEFHCEHVCPAGCQAGFIDGWPASGQALVEASCFDDCDAVLIDNEGSPAAYPPVVVQTPEVEERFQVAWYNFQQAHNLAGEAYRVEIHAVTWTPQLEWTGGAWALIAPGGVDEASAQAAADALFDGHPALFGLAGAPRTIGRVTCSGSWCRAVQQQSYCGLDITSSSPDHDGTLRARFDLASGGLLDAFSAAVPLEPLPRNPTWTREQVAAGLVGQELEFWCADGRHTALVTANSQFEFEDDPVVFTRLADGGGEALEIRLAHRLRLMPEDWLSWQVIIDAIDGSTLRIETEFICD